jgi:hypothetical protein
VAVVEVQRFWARYKQLGCDKNSNLGKKGLENPQLTQDSFVKNVIFLRKILKITKFNRLLKF